MRIAARSGPATRSTDLRADRPLRRRDARRCAPESADFAPRDTDAWLSPHVGGPPPASAQGVFRVAQSRLRIVRRHYPGATGRMLSVVRCGPNGNRRVTIPLLIGDERAA